jgi:hypothetical protein
MLPGASSRLLGALPPLAKTRMSEGTSPLARSLRLSRAPETLSRHDDEHVAASPSSPFPSPSCLLCRLEGFPRLVPQGADVGFFCFDFFLLVIFNQVPLGPPPRGSPRGATWAGLQASQPSPCGIGALLGLYLSPF